MCKYYKIVAFFQIGVCVLQKRSCLVTHCKPGIWNVAAKFQHFAGLKLKEGFLLFYVKFHRLAFIPFLESEISNLSCHCKSHRPRDLSTIRSRIFLSCFLLKSSIIQNSKTEEENTLHFSVSF